MSAPARSHLCRLCGVPFPDVPGSPRLARVFCARCLDLAALAARVVADFERSGAVERFGDHAVVIPANLPRREAA